MLFSGLEPHNAVRAREIRVEDGCTHFVATCAGEEIPVTLPAIGLHHVRNALAALACAHTLGVPPADAAAALRTYAGVTHRQETLRFPQMGITVIDDSYNASPDSMRAAITALAMTPCDGRKVAVLGDMWELGEESPAYHREVGETLGKSDADILVTVGELSRHTAEGALSVNPSLPVVATADWQEAFAWLEENRREGDLILLKASNGMRLFEIAECWKKRR